MDFDAFPALDRAKLRFLQRQARCLADSKEREPGQIVSRSRECRRIYGQPCNESDALHLQQLPPSTSKNTNSTSSNRAHDCVVEFCSGLDHELQSINAEVDAIGISMRAEHQRILTDANETLAFLTRNIDVNVCRTKSILRRYRPVIRIRHHRYRIKLLATSKPNHVAKPIVQDATASALEIQTRFRGYLWGRLYQGGRRQFVRACQLRRRIILAKFWRAWLQFRDQAKLARRQRMEQILLRMKRMSGHWRRTKAERVKVYDGNYGMAKQFSEVVMYARIFRAWLSLAIPSDDG